MEVVIPAQQVFKEAADRSGPSEQPDLRTPQNGVRGIEGFQGVHVTAVYSRKEAARKLHWVGGRGLLQGRLVEPEVGEGAVAIEVDRDPRHLAAMELEDACYRDKPSAQRHSAGFGSAAGRGKHEYSVGVHLSIRLRLGPLALPRAQKVCPAGGHAGYAGP